MLDTGAPDDGADVLIVNGVDGSQRLQRLQAGRQTSARPTTSSCCAPVEYIASTPTSATANEIADDPAFVALLHGNFGTADPVAA